MKNKYTINAGFLILAILFLNGFSATAQSKNYKKELSELTKYYDQALHDWEVPGMAVAIVKDDQVIFAEGFGLREIGGNEAVDEQTMFPIASNTKAFTAAALAILVDQGKIDWNDKVIEHLPWFRMYNPYVTANMTIRDLLSHRSGLATFSGDLLWYGTTYNRQEIVERARYLEPVYGFRENFGYSNIMYVAAGLIIPAVSGQSWDDFVEANFLDPLQMNRSITSTTQLSNFDNVASPHTDFNDEVIVVDYLNWDNVAPAGAIISSVSDVAQWLKLQLNRGIWDGDTIFSPQQSHEMWSQHTVQGVSGWSEKNWPSTTFKSYGLGWSLSNYLGHKIVGHSGGYDGMISYTCMVPDQDLAFVILTNKNSSLYYPLIYKTLDVFLDGGDKDWSAFMLDIMDKSASRDAAVKEEKIKSRVESTQPSLDLNAYTGIYTSEMYGDAEVKLEQGKLSVQLVPAPQFIGRLKHWHFDTFEITFTEFPSLPPGFCTFVLDKEGKVSELKIDVPNPDFDFTELKFNRKK